LTASFFRVKFSKATDLGFLEEYAAFGFARILRINASGSKFLILELVCCL